jgi:hypothetical protein
MLFIDTSAFLAIVNDKDKWHGRADEFLNEIKKGKVKFRRIITSDYIIDETLTRIRYAIGHREAVEWGRNILASKVVDRITVDSDTFNEAWKLFESYEDKFLSFTDCTSFAIMRKKGIKKAFAFDEDFERVGFKILP